MLYGSKGTALRECPVGGGGGHKGRVLRGIRRQIKGKGFRILYYEMIIHDSFRRIFRTP